MEYKKKTKTTLQKVLQFYISFMIPSWEALDEDGEVSGMQMCPQNQGTSASMGGVHKDTELKQPSESSKQKNSCKINKTRLHPSLQRARTTWIVLIQL